MTRDQEVLKENVSHLISEARKCGHSMSDLGAILIGGGYALMFENGGDVKGAIEACEIAAEQDQSTTQ